MAKRNKAKAVEQLEKRLAEANGRYKRLWQERSKLIGAAPIGQMDTAAIEINAAQIAAAVAEAKYLRQAIELLTPTVNPFEDEDWLGLKETN